MESLDYDAVGKFVRLAGICKVGLQQFLGLDEYVQEFTASAVSLPGKKPSRRF